MPKTIPLLLAQSTISVFVADMLGQPILTQPVWIGARAENLELGGEIAETEATASGATYDQFQQLSELHEINIDRIWVLPFGTEAGPGARKMVDYDLTRGQYVMQVYGLDERTGLWHQRTYYGVQAKRYGLRSNGILQFGSNQVFRAQYYTTSSGTSATDGTLTPITPTGFEQPLLFTHDDAVAAGDYFIGYYQFSSVVRVGFTKAIANASQGSSTVLALEIAGSTTASVLTLPSGSLGAQVQDSQTFNVLVPAHTSIRWKVTSAPGSGQASLAGVTMSVVEV